MKYSLLIVFALVAGCATPKAPPTRVATPIKVSHHYSRAAVMSYTTHLISIPDHRFALFHLKSGETLPMLCQETPKGIYPIPQSVFSNAERDTWSIVAEPKIGNAYALGRFPLSLKNGRLYLGAKPLKPSRQIPPLLSQP
jgi:hypothetical protein